MLPFTVCSEIEGAPSSLSKLAFTAPFTVDKRASPARFCAVTGPFTEEIFTSPETPLTSTPPLTVSTAESRARRGTFSVYSTLAESL